MRRGAAAIPPNQAKSNTAQQNEVPQQRRSTSRERKTKATAALSASKFDLSAKKNVDTLVKDLEKELTGVQTDVIDSFNKLERKIQCFRKPKGQLIIEQKNNCAERYLEQLIIEMEFQQLAESVV